MVGRGRLRARQGEEGQALLLSLVVLLLVSIALSLLAGSLSLHQQAVVEEVRDVQLRAMTDAALARTLAELKQDRRYPGLPQETFARGLIASEVTPLSGLEVRVAAVATLGARQQAVGARVRLPLKAPPTVTAWQRIGVPDEMVRQEPY